MFTRAGQTDHSLLYETVAFWLETVGGFLDSGPQLIAQIVSLATDIAEKITSAPTISFTTVSHSILVPLLLF